MLVLSRKVGQQLRIDDRITLTILKIQGRSIRIGVEAPKEVHVLRGELPRKERPRSEIGSDQRQHKSRCSVHEPSERPLQSRVDHRQSRRSSHADRWTVESMKARTQGRATSGVSSPSRSVANHF